jgi:hypothetical protein
MRLLDSKVELDTCWPKWLGVNWDELIHTKSETFTSFKHLYSESRVILKRLTARCHELAAKRNSDRDGGLNPV